jgi:succinate-acetate transporter protein
MTGNDRTMMESTTRTNAAPRASIRLSKASDSISTKNDSCRLVVVRYFLDRPGYDLRHSSARLWENPPGICTASNVKSFLERQGIAIDNVLIEVFIDKFQSYMLLQACISSNIEWNFEDTTIAEPGILTIRLTDMVYAKKSEEKEAAPNAAEAAAVPTQQQEQANTTPLGLFSFSMMVGLESAALMGRLIPGSINMSFVLKWGPYMLFVGGLLQVIVGIFQVIRGNLYGATAFLGFGTLLFSFGSSTILETYFSGEVPEELLDLDDPLGSAIRNWYVLAFTAVLLKQTFVMNKLSTTLISLLCIKILAASLAGWSNAMAWMQMISGWLTSIFAFFVFTVELTNSMYHRQVFPTFKWDQHHSPEEVFGAAGRQSTLYSRAARLRHAGSPSVHSVRSILPPEERSSKQE